MEAANSPLESLDEAEGASLDEVWSKENARRIEELDSGTVNPIPWTEARRQISEILVAKNLSNPR